MQWVKCPVALSCFVVNETQQSARAGGGQCGPLPPRTKTHKLQDLVANAFLFLSLQKFETKKKKKEEVVPHFSQVRGQPLQEITPDIKSRCKKQIISGRVVEGRSGRVQPFRKPQKTPSLEEALKRLILEDTQRRKQLISRDRLPGKYCKRLRSESKRLAAIRLMVRIYVLSRTGQSQSIPM